jgi:ubiquinone biosynthesis protein
MPLIAQKLDALEADAAQRNLQQHRGRRKLIALLAFGAAGYFLYQDLQGSAVLRDWIITDVSPSTIVLGAIGMLALWFRK